MTSHLSLLTESPAAQPVPAEWVQPASMPALVGRRMANLDLLMDCRENAYDEMRRLVPGLAWSAEERAELSLAQRAATERFEELNRQVRSFRSI